MKVAIVGDSFIDRYYYGEVDRISPEAPVPILDITKAEARGGGALNVANNVHSLGIDLTLFTILGSYVDAPFKIMTPRDCTTLLKDRFISNSQQLMRVDNPKKYPHKDIKRVTYPKEKDFDIIAYVDYNKGVVNGGKADIVDTKKEDLSVFEGTKILKVNDKEYNKSINKEHFEDIYVTCGSKGIKYFKKDQLVSTSTSQSQEVIDITGAGDTVMAVMIYCLANGIKDPDVIMKLSNKAAGTVISKFGTSIITKEELFN